MIITAPSQVAVPSGSCTPTQVSGVDSGLTCTFDNGANTITVNNAFSSATAPSTVSFKVASLTNPSAYGTTDSFQIFTQTSSGDGIDSITAGLTVEYACDSSCKTCGASATTCTSCYTTSTLKYLAENSCVDTCPAGSYASTSSNECVSC